MSGDFDKDGYADLVFCKQGRSRADSRVMVVFGGPDGLGADAVEVDAAGDDPEAGGCGSLIAIDFNRDGYPDLVLFDYEGVHVAAGNENTRQADGWVFERLIGPYFDGFYRPAVGDMNGDGHHDLVYSRFIAAGSGVSGVVIHHGGPAGLSGPRAGPTIDGGMAFALGDLDGDGYAEFAAGQSSGDDTSRAGRVLIWSGSPDGIDFESDPVVVHQNTPGVPGVSEPDDLFGVTLEIADTDADRYGDLVVGVPYEDVEGSVDAGHVVVIPGGPNLLDRSRAIGVHEGKSGMPGELGDGRLFGTQIAPRDFTLDRRYELAVSAPGGSGSVTLLLTDEGGITRQGARLFRPEDVEIAPEGASFGVLRDL